MCSIKVSPKMVPKERPRAMVKNFAVAAVVAAVALVLVFPAPGGSQEIEVGEVMSRIEGAYTEVVNSLLIFPVQEMGDEAPFDKISERLGEIAETARLLPRIENYEDDSSFRNFAGGLEKRAGEMAALAKKKSQAESITALARLQAACLECHKNFRF
ncbi:MAG: hypothetical protein CMH76_01300 [Nitrospinae bacterium]|nr:hypothetical protein [Nitrospinota bacterium]